MGQRKKRAVTRRGRAATRGKARKPVKSVRGKSAQRTRAKISLKQSRGVTMGSADWPRLQRPVDRLRDLITADRASAAREQGRKYLQSRKAGLLDKLWSPMILE